MSMFVMKRNGKRESVHFDKITSRIQKLCGGLDPVSLHLAKSNTQFGRPLMRCVVIVFPIAVHSLTHSLVLICTLHQTAARRCRHCGPKGHSGSLPRCHNVRAG